MNHCFSKQIKELVAVLFIFMFYQAATSAQDSSFKLTDAQKNEITSTANKKALQTLALEIEFIEQTCSIDAQQKHELQSVADAIAQECADEVVKRIESTAQGWENVASQLVPNATISTNIDSSKLGWGIANTVEHPHWESSLDKILTSEQQEQLANAKETHVQQLRASLVEFVINAVRVQIKLSEDQTKQVTAIVDKHIDNHAALHYLANFQDNPLQSVYSIPTKQFRPILSEEQLDRWKEIRRHLRR